MKRPFFLRPIRVWLLMNHASKLVRGPEEPSHMRSRRITGRLAFLVILATLTITQSGVTHAQTAFALSSSVEHTVLIKPISGPPFGQGSDDSPTTTISTSFADPEVGSFSASSSSTLSGSSSGAHVTASIAGDATGVLSSGGVRVFATQGTLGVYSFTIDAPTVVELHGQVHGECANSPQEECQYTVLFGLGYPGSGYSPVPGWSLYVDSNSQPTSVAGSLDVGPLLLEPGSYFLNEYMIAGAVGGPNLPAGFSLQLDVTLSIGGSAPPPPEPVAKVIELIGTPTVIHSDGTRDPIALDTVFYPGDVVETGSGDAVNILFADGTTIAVTESARLTMDEFTPASSQSNGFFDWLQGLFVYTSGLIGSEGPGEVNIQPFSGGGPGVRGDAADFVCDTLAQTDHRCDAGVLMEDVASPVSLIAPVPAAPGPRRLSFWYAFLAPTGRLEVFLDDTLIYTTLSTDHPTKVFQHATIDLPADATTVQNSMPVAVFFDPPAQFSKSLVLVPANGVRLSAN